MSPKGDSIFLRMMHLQIKYISDLRWKRYHIENIYKPINSENMSTITEMQNCQPLKNAEKPEKLSVVKMTVILFQILYKDQ